MVRVALITCRPPVLGGQKKFSKLERAKNRLQLPSPPLPSPSRTRARATPFLPTHLVRSPMAKFKLWQFLLSPLVNVKEVFPPRASPSRGLFIYPVARIRHGQGTAPRQGAGSVNRRSWHPVERMEIRRGPVRGE